MNAQCEHEFVLDEKTGEVRCIKCGDLDDEMQLAVKNPEALDRRDREELALETQINME